MLAVMYHYVRNYDPDYPNFKNLTIEQFKRQINFFDNLYGFITKKDFITSINENRAIKNGVVLTFDDGLKDHYNNILPVLKKKNLWAFFYIPTYHYHNKKVLDVHRVHHLLGKYDARVLLKESLNATDASMFNKNKIHEFDKEIYKDQQLSSHEYRFKRLFNYYLRKEYKTALLDELMHKYLNEKLLYDKLYMTKEELFEMEKYGSVIGSHTMTHSVLSTLNYEQQKKEIEGSYAFLDSFLDMNLKSFCYPYGSRATYNVDSFKVLKDCGVHHAFAVNNEPLNIIKNKYELTRIDCNRFIK